MNELTDSALPGLSHALEPACLLERLRYSWATDLQSPDLMSLSVLKVQYKPRKRCSILYSLKYRPRPGGRSRKLPLSALLLPVGEAFPTLPPQATAHQRKSPLPSLEFPELGMAVYVFPVDAALPCLPEAMDPAAMKASLGRQWKEHGVRVRRVEVQRIGYTPGARAAMLYDVHGEFVSSGLPQLRRLVGKMDATRNAPQIFMRSWSLWRAAAGRPGFALPVGYDTALNLYLQEWVPGDRLSDLVDGGAFLGLVRQTARIVALLHSLDVPLRSRRTPEKEARTVHRWGSSLAAIRPQQRHRIRRLRDHLAREMECRARITGAVHGDLHPSNIISDGNKVTLIDLDNTARGDRLLDVGRFLSALRTSSLRVHGTHSGLSEAGDAFLDHYLELTGEDPRRARLFEAAALLTSAGTGFRLQRPGWEESADLLIDEVERVMKLADKGKPSGVRRVESAGAPVPIDRPRWAMDGPYVMAALALPVRQQFGVELTSCKPEWRRATATHARLRYRLRGWHQGSRWARSVEGFLRTTGGGQAAARRLGALREALQGRPGAPQVPRLVAYVPEIGLQVMTIPRGLPITPEMESEACGRTATRLVRALVALHGTPLDLDRSHEVEAELAALRQQAESGSGKNRPFMDLLEQVEHQMRGLPAAKKGPTLRRLDPGHILLLSDGIGLPEVQDVVLSHPLLDVGDFLARMALLSLRNQEPAGLALLTRRLREDYPAGNHEISVFEAAALLKLACSMERRRSEPELAARLLSLAGNALTAASLPEKSTA